MPDRETPLSRVTDRLAASRAFRVDRAATPADAQPHLDQHKDYGSVVATPAGLVLVVSPAASAAVAQVRRRGRRLTREQEEAAIAGAAAA